METLKDFLKKMNFEEGVIEKMHSAFRSGRNNVYNNVVSEAVTLDDSWILTIESALYSVESIIKNPRKFIIDQELLVDVEKARKTNAKTVRHLSSNSQFVQNISEDGEITPKKLLTTEMDEDLAIYENRFICSLVNLLIPFVETRYNDIIGRVNTFDQTGIGVASAFKYGTSEIEYKLNVKVRQDPKDKVLLERNTELIEKINLLRKRLKVLLNTDFMRMLSGKKPVRPPIVKTNLIKMNVDYNNCYKLWLYVSSYTFSGFSVQYQDKNLPVDSDYYDDLTLLAALTIQSLYANHKVNEENFDTIKYKEIKEKKFRLITAYKFEPNFFSDKKGAGEDTVNEFYFKQMRNELIRATKRGSIQQEKDLKLSFARFCRSIAKINGDMYEDVINSQVEDDKSLKRKTAIQKKDFEVRKQKLLLRRYRQLSLLKREELEKILRLEARELIKLEKLQAALDKEKGRQANKRLRKKQKKEKLAKIKAKKAYAEANAKEYEQELRDKDAARLAAIEEQKIRKREAAQRRRDLKRLQELKDKYDDQD
ncbi:MAG: hypothetical protein J6U25_03025 [Clostridia bacterium]|nr:hypothetical protein [Clostridia bacterium]